MNGSGEANQQASKHTHRERERMERDLLLPLVLPLAESVFLLLFRAFRSRGGEPTEAERRRKKVAGGSVQARKRTKIHFHLLRSFAPLRLLYSGGGREGGALCFHFSPLPLPPFSRPSSPSSSPPSFFFHFPPPVSAISEMTVPLSTPPLFLQLPFSLPLSPPCLCIHYAFAPPLFLPLQLLFPSPRQ